MNTYLTKPFQPEQVSTAICYVMQEVAPFAKVSRANVLNIKTPSDENESKQGLYSVTVAQVTSYFASATPLNKEQLHRVIVMTGKSIVENLDAADSAVEQKNYKALAMAAHTLKGTLLQCGIFGWAEKAQVILDSAVFNLE